MHAFNIGFGEGALNLTWQDEFPSTTPCCRCDGTARIGFVAVEEPSTDGTKREFVCNMRQNDPTGEGYWLHDACAVAVYFCKKCLEPPAL